MATRNYKAGPRRSRRRPDPSTIVKPGESIAITDNGASFGGSGTADIDIVSIDPTTGTDWAGADFVNTGVPSKSYAKDQDDVIHPLVASAVLPNGQIQFQQLTGLPVGVLNVFITPLDPAFRTTDGGYLSGAYFTVNITA